MFKLYIYPQLIFDMNQYFIYKIDEGDINWSQCTTRNNFTINDKKIAILLLSSNRKVGGKGAKISHVENS